MIFVRSGLQMRTAIQQHPVGAAQSHVVLAQSHHAVVRRLIDVGARLQERKSKNIPNNQKGEGGVNGFFDDPTAVTLHRHALQRFADMHCGREALSRKPGAAAAVAFPRGHPFPAIFTGPVLTRQHHGVFCNLQASGETDRTTTTQRHAKQVFCKMLPSIQNATNRA